MQGLSLCIAGAGFDVDARALFARMPTQPSGNSKRLQSNLIRALKSGGYWSKIDALWVTAAHSEAAAMLDWKGTYDLTKGGSPTFTAYRGFRGDGSAAYLNTNWTPSTHGSQFQQNAATFCVYVNGGTDAVSTSAVLGGCTDVGTNNVFVIPRFTGSTARFRVNANVSQNMGSVPTIYGQFGYNRSSSTANEGYRNGAANGTASQASSGRPAQPLYLLALNANGTASNFADFQIAYAFVGASLSAAEYAAIHGIFQTYLLNVGGAGVLDAPAIDAQTLPDGASASTAGKGFTNTGLALLPDGTWWVGNHGKALSGDPSYAPSLVHLSADFTTILDEILLAPLYPGIESVQGVAYDPSDGTLWFADLAGAKIRHITTAGVVISGDEITPTWTPNGIAIDPANDRIWIAREAGGGANIEARSLSDGTVQVSAFSTGVSNQDMLHFDAATGILMLSFGANGSAGQVKMFYAPATNSLDACIVGPLSGADAIEGVSWNGAVLTVMNDGYFHSGSPALNRVMRYSLPRG